VQSVTFRMVDSSTENIRPWLGILPWNSGVPFVRLCGGPKRDMSRQKDETPLQLNVALVPTPRLIGCRRLSLVHFRHGSGGRRTLVNGKTMVNRPVLQRQILRTYERVMVIKKRRLRSVQLQMTWCPDYKKYRQ